MFFKCNFTKRIICMNKYVVNWSECSLKSKRIYLSLCHVTSFSFYDYVYIFYCIYIYIYIYIYSVCVYVGVFYKDKLLFIKMTNIIPKWFFITVSFQLFSFFTILARKWITMSVSVPLSLSLSIYIYIRHNC